MLDDNDKKWISGQIELLREQIERVETNLLTEFYNAERLARDKS